MISIAVAAIDAASVRVTVTGDIDMLTGPRLQAALMDAVDTHHPQCVIIDAANMGFLDASGMSALIRAYDYAHQQQAEAQLINVQAHIRRTLSVVGLISALRVTPTG